MDLFILLDGLLWNVDIIFKITSRMSDVLLPRHNAKETEFTKHGMCFCFDSQLFSWSTFRKT